MNKKIATPAVALVIAASFVVAGCTQVKDAKVGQSPAPAQSQSSGGKSTLVKNGNYELELLVPESGLFAGQELDVEIHITDSTKKDPVEGNLGIANIEVDGVVVMPSMPGMAEQKLEIHREGIPGFYGIEVYFPHGGEYQLNLNVAIPGEKAFPASFLVDVKDEAETATGSTAKPYTLKVIGFPEHADSASSIDLKLQVTDTESNKVQTQFQTVHEKQFHLLIASEDLGWFAHEHPVMGSDGTWSAPIKFPAAGKYWIYGDVAPSGKSSQVLIAQVNVMHGSKPTWNTTLVPTLGPTVVKGVSASLKPLDNPIPVQKSSTLEVQLTTLDGKPVLDTKKWLGAAGHMVIIHQDGQTVVHSHPLEDPETVELANQGIFRFSGRFPKTGVYKTYAQFSHQGEIKTFGFVIEIK